MNRKIIVFVSMVLLLIGSSPHLVHAEEQKIVYSDGYYYYHLEDGYISICGYFGKEEVVDIPPYIIALPVSRIESGAFKGCNTVKTIRLPETIMEIQENAFEGADNLSMVTDYTGTDVDDSWSGTDSSETDSSEIGSDETDIPPMNDGTPMADSSDNHSDTENKAGKDEYTESNDEEQREKENKENLQKIEEVLNNSSNEQKIIDSESNKNTTTESLPGDKKTESDNTKGLGAVKGLSVAVATGIIVLAVLLFVIYKKKKHRRDSL